MFIYNKDKKYAELLVTRLFFEDLSISDCVDWAKELMKRSFKSPSLEKIANRKATKKKTYYKLFLSALNELGVKLSEDEEKMFERYAFYTGDLYYSNKISALEALRKFIKILSAAGNKESYVGFFKLANQYDLIEKNASIKEIGHKEKELFVEKFETILLRYLESISKDNYRKKFEAYIDKKLVSIKYFKHENYNAFSLRIVSDIIKERNLTKKQIEDIRIEIGRNWWGL